jgi:4-amino-4-deoxy-L-arabinose transferase-like glycosyltransferase
MHIHISSRLSRHALLLILLAYLIAGAIYATSVPFLEVSDEVRHYAMVEHLAQGNGLPIQDEALNQRILDEERRGHRPLTYYAQEGSQPPLYYALMALVALPFDRSDHAERVWPNPHAKLGRADATNNWNQLIHAPEAEAFPWRGTVLVVMLMRLIGVALGAATVAGCYALGRALGGPAVGALAAALVAFNPMFVHIMASVNNDTLATTLSTLSLWLGTCLIQGQADLRRGLLLGATLGGAALTKASGLALVLVVPAFVMAARLRQAREAATLLRGSALRLIGLGAAMWLPAVLIAGWWYVRNQWLYGDFTGTTMMARIAGAREALPSWRELLGEWDGFYKAFWGLFGAVNIPMDLWIYDALEGLLILIGFGLLLVASDWLRRGGWRSALDARAWIALMLFTAFGVALAALVRWTSLTLASQGRLLFPVIGAFAALGALGIAQISQLVLGQRWRWAGFGLAIALALLTLLAPFIYIQPAYALPQRLPSVALPALDQQTELVFAQQIRYLGFRVNTPRQRVRPGDILDVTVYWQGLRRMERNYSAFIRVYGKGDVVVHVLDTYPGGGMWPTTLWTPGEVIADRYRLRIEDTVTNTQLAPSTLWLDVGVWDFSTQRFLDTFEPSGRPTGRQRYEAASLYFDQPTNEEAPAGPRFAHAVPLNARVEHSGDALTLRLDWLVTADVQHDYTTFVQLFDQVGNKLPPQADARALGGGFAPRWWRKGDRIFGDAYTLTLPADLPSGAYIVKFGLYRADGSRMPAYDQAGNAIPDAALRIPVEIIR